MPEVHQDRKVSPFDVGDDVYSSQVQNAQMFKDWCRAVTDHYDSVMEQSPADDQTEIQTY